MNHDDTLYPCSFVIFGATGHLAATKLLPALYHLEAKGRLPEVTNFIAFARRPWDEAAWCAHMETALRGSLASLRRRCSNASRRFSYVPATCRTSKLTSACSRSWASPRPACARTSSIYLAIKPSDFAHGGQQPRRGRTEPPARAAPVVVEKPFGEDLESAQRAQPGAAPALRRAADLSHRPLSGQGNGAEPARVPLRQPA